MHGTCTLIACMVVALPLFIYGVDAQDSVERFLSIYRVQASTSSTKPAVGSKAAELLKYARAVHAVAFSNDIKLRDPASGNILGFDRRAALIHSLIGTVKSGFHESMRDDCEDYPLACGAVTPPPLYKRIRETNELLEELYPRLIEALTNATTKLERNETFGNDQVCSPEDARSILCEFETFQAMVTDECANITIKHCLPESANVERCIINESGTLYSVKKIVRFRVVHLLSAFGICNSVTDWTDKIASMATKITEALSTASWNLENVTWTHPAEKIAIDVMRELPQLSWPESSAYNVKYNQLVGSIDKRMSEAWGDEMYKSFAFYDCGNTECYSLNGLLASNKREKPLSTSPWLKHPLHFIQRTGINAVVWRGSNKCGDSTRKEALAKIKDEIMNHGLGSYNGTLIAGCFPAAVVVKCAHRFVWQELAWTYFHATSNTTYAVESGTTPYKPCTRTVLLP